MVVSLRDCGTVPGVSLAAALIGFAEGLINFGSFLIDPGEQGRSKVETDLRIIVHHLHDALFAVQDSRRGIGRVAFG